MRGIVPRGGVHDELCLHAEALFERQKLLDRRPVRVGADALCTLRVVEQRNEQLRRLRFRIVDEAVIAAVDELIDRVVVICEHDAALAHDFIENIHAVPFSGQQRGKRIARILPADALRLATGHVHIVRNAVFRRRVQTRPVHGLAALFADQIQVKRIAAAVQLAEDAHAAVLPLDVGDAANVRQAHRVKCLRIIPGHVHIHDRLLRRDVDCRAPEVERELLSVNAQNVVERIGAAAVIRCQQEVFAAAHRQRDVGIILQRPQLTPPAGRDRLEDIRHLLRAELPQGARNAHMRRRQHPHMGAFRHAVHEIIMPRAQALARRVRQMQRQLQRTERTAVPRPDLDQVLALEVCALHDRFRLGRIEQQIDRAAALEQHLKRVVKCRQTRERLVVHTAEDRLHSGVVHGDV